MNLNRITQITIGLSLITAITKYGIYAWPFRMIGQEGFWHPAMVGINILSVLFIISPILALFLYFKKSNSCYFWLGVFPFSAFMFGVVPIPFSNYLYTSNINLNTIIIAIINIVFVAIAWFLYRANKSSKKDALTARASS